MTIPAAFAPALPAMGAILVAMAVVAGIETLLPLHAPGRWNRAHLAPNLALTFLTFGTNFLLNAAVVAGIVWLEDRGFGLLGALSLPPLVAGGSAIVVLDFSFYVLHVGMHKIPRWWRYHAVHHSDPAVDVTTTIRQHPMESLLRYAFIAVFAFALVPSLAAFGAYRVLAALSGLLEHANIRLPLWLDRLLALVTTWPNLHKVHHSRVAAQTDTNYGNLLSVWDRLFGTFTPSFQGAAIEYGLDGFDASAAQTTIGLLAMPWRGRAIEIDRGPSAGSKEPVCRNDGRRETHRAAPARGAEVGPGGQRAATGCIVHTM